MADQPVQLMETQEEIAFELRSAEGAIWTGGRLSIGMGAMAFAALAFAYFYLRSYNNQGLWRPHHMTAPTMIGAAIVTTVVASAVIHTFGHFRLRHGFSIDWEVAGWTAVLGGLLAIGLQIWELTQLPFQPGASGYSSCFLGWAVMNLGLLFFATYWVETLLARSLRLRRAIAEDGGTSRSSLPAARLFRASLESCTYFWLFTALVSVLFWVLFYVV